MPDRMTRLLIRQGLLCVGIPVVVAFVVSSPGRLGFWAALVGVFLITLPGFAAVSWFWSDTRRTERAGSSSRDAPR
jgi:hypothetical protein